MPMLKMKKFEIEEDEGYSLRCEKALRSGEIGLARSGKETLPFGKGRAGEGM